MLHRPRGKRALQGRGGARGVLCCASHDTAWFFGNSLYLQKKYDSIFFSWGLGYGHQFVMHQVISTHNDRKSTLKINTAVWRWKLSCQMVYFFNTFGFNFTGITTLLTPPLVFLVLYKIWTHNKEYLLIFTLIEFNFYDSTYLFLIWVLNGMVHLNSQVKLTSCM